MTIKIIYGQKVWEDNTKSSHVFLEIKPGLYKEIPHFMRLEAMKDLIEIEKDNTDQEFFTDTYLKVTLINIKEYEVNVEK